MRRALLAFAYFGAAVVALAFLVLPIVAIFVHVPPGRLLDQFSNPVVTDALIVSLKTTLIAQALILLFGTPTAWLLASRRFRGRSLLRDARRAAAGAAAGRRGHRPARRLRTRSVCSARRSSSPGSRSRSRRPQSRSRSRSSRARSTSGRRSPRSRRSTRTSSPRRERSAPAPRARSSASCCRSRAAAWRRARRSRSHAASASSARRSCSPAASRG